jgi:hypothetical protein
MSAKIKHPTRFRADFISCRRVEERRQHFPNASELSGITGINCRLEDGSLLGGMEK